MDGADAAETSQGDLGAMRGSRRVAGEIFEARRAAREILGRAARGAADIRAAALVEASRLRAEAEAAGRRDGMAAAAADLLRAALDRERQLASLEPRVLELAVEVASTILGRAVVAGEDARRAARAALAELGASRRAVLRASPVDAASLRDGCGAEEALPGHLRVVVDPALSPGEVVVEAAGSTVDGRFAAQLDAIRRALRESPA